MLLNLAQIVCLTLVAMCLGGVSNILSPLFWIGIGAAAVYGFLNWFEGRYYDSKKIG